LTIISILDENFNFSRKLHFFAENYNFWRNFNFSLNFQFLMKISLFDEKFRFWPKFQFLMKTSIIDENFHYWRKFPLLQKFPILPAIFWISFAENQFYLSRRPCQVYTLSRCRKNYMFGEDNYLDESTGETFYWPGQRCKKVQCADVRKPRQAMRNGSSKFWKVSWTLTMKIIVILFYQKK